MPGFEESKFIDLTERVANHLMCSICLNIFDNAVMSECGHSFCKACVQQWVEGQHNKCPNCKTQFSRKRMISNENQVFIAGYVFKPNFTANGIISDLKTKCEFEFNGCPEVMDFGLLSTHMKVCEHRLCKTCGSIAGRPEVHNCEQILSKSESSNAVPEDHKYAAEGMDPTEPNPEEGVSAERRENINRCVGHLTHAVDCGISSCDVLGCKKMKLVIQHTKNCRKARAPNSLMPVCMVCKQLISLCCYHAKSCQDINCRVPYCSGIKIKMSLARIQEQMAQNLRRRGISLDGNRS